ncbi:hypothetical protein [Cohnella boryungensis]|uniref:Transposase n=1 Tax=Cohnella boryungensis TaxID=768479 RepID=A0ABV8SA97_9BACL
MTKSRPLSMTTVHRQHRTQYGKTKRVHLSNGYYVDVQEKFKPTDGQKLVVDYQQVLQQMKKEGLDVKTGRDMLFVYYMLLLKHFTSLGDAIPEKLDQMILLCEKMLDLGIMEELIGAFPAEELEKLTLLLQRAAEGSQLLAEHLRKPAQGGNHQ